jgi:trehalose utilization protein
MDKTRITVWHEFRHEKKDKAVADVYPKGIHAALADHLKKQPDFAVKTATLDEPEHGLSESALKGTDVLLWWGHCAHGEVKDEIVDRVYNRVLEGMGLIVLHSGHHSKIFRKLMGTSCNLCWREAGERSRIWVIEPYHPITEGLDGYFELEHEEMYGERFDVPEPDKVIFISWFQGGEVFRSGLTYTRGLGKIFYFQPGHETYPNYFNKDVLKVLTNAARWAKFSGNASLPKGCPQIKKPFEKI